MVDLGMHSLSEWRRNSVWLRNGCLAARLGWRRLKGLQRPQAGPSGGCIVHLSQNQNMPPTLPFGRQLACYGSANCGWSWAGRTGSSVDGSLWLSKPLVISTWSGQVHLCGGLHVQFIDGSFACGDGYGSVCLSDGSETSEGAHSMVAQQ